MKPQSKVHFKQKCKTLKKKLIIDGYNENRVGGAKQKGVRLYVGFVRRSSAKKPKMSQKSNHKQ